MANIYVRDLATAYFKRSDAWALEDAFASYFMGLAAWGARDAFLNYYLALEALLSAFADRNKLKYWVSGKRERKLLRERVFGTLDDWSSEVEFESALPRDKVTDLLRLSARQLQYQFLTTVGVEMSDMDLGGRFEPTNTHAFPWIRVRNRLFHSGRSVKQGELLLEAERLRVILERAFLRILGVDRSVRIDADQPFRLKATSFSIPRW